MVMVINPQAVSRVSGVRMCTGQRGRQDVAHATAAVMIVPLPLPVHLYPQELYVQQIKHIHPTAFTWQYIKVPSSNGDRQ